MGLLALTPSLLHSILVNETAGLVSSGVCFSPNSRLLATGTQNGVVHVSSRIFVLVIIIAATIFEANAQNSVNFGTLDLGYHQEANLQQIPGSHLEHQFIRFLVGWEIPRLWVERWYDEDLEYEERVVEDPCRHRRGFCCS